MKFIGKELPKGIHFFVLEGLIGNFFFWGMESI
jgi:hypothetical protein